MARHFVYRIDSNDLITFVNDEWLSFAQENELARGTGWRKRILDSTLNELIWNFVDGAETKYLWQILLKKVRTDSSSINVPFRCDSPDCRRFMEMNLSLLPNEQVQFESRLLRQEPREPTRLLNRVTETPPRLLRMCSWCKKIHVPDFAWLEAEEAFERLDLLGESRPPQFTHGACPGCAQQIHALLK